MSRTSTHVVFTTVLEERGNLRWLEPPRYPFSRADPLNVSHVLRSRSPMIVKLLRQKARIIREDTGERDTKMVIGDNAREGNWSAS